MREVQWPSPEGDDLQGWARRLIITLQTAFSEGDSEIGKVVIFTGTQLPYGYISPNGAVFLAKTYPVLARRLGGTTLPNLASPIAGTILGIKVG